MKTIHLLSRGDHDYESGDDVVIKAFKSERRAERVCAEFVSEQQKLLGEKKAYSDWTSKWLEEWKSKFGFHVLGNTNAARAAAARLGDEFRFAKLQYWAIAGVTEEHAKKVIAASDTISYEVYEVELDDEEEE